MARALSCHLLSVDRVETKLVWEVEAAAQLTSTPKTLLHPPATYPSNITASTADDLLPAAADRPAATRFAAVSPPRVYTNRPLTPTRSPARCPVVAAAPLHPRSYRGITSQAPSFLLSLTRDDRHAHPRHLLCTYLLAPLLQPLLSMSQ